MQVFIDGGSRKNTSAICAGFYISLQFFGRKNGPEINGVSDIIMLD
jgi:hypothetical protein